MPSSLAVEKPGGGWDSAAGHYLLSPIYPSELAWQFLEEGKGVVVFGIQYLLVDNLIMIN